MGDRGNIAIIHAANNGHRAQVWIYSHWGGTDLPQLLQDGLKAGKSRFDDESYLTKIIIGRAIPPNVMAGETGAGVSTRMQDNEHDILVVDIPGKRVFTMKEAELDENGQVPALFEVRKYWSFEQYCDLKKLPVI